MDEPLIYVSSTQGVYIECPCGFDGVQTNDFSNSDDHIEQTTECPQCDRKFKVSISFDVEEVD